MENGQILCTRNKTGHSIFIDYSFEVPSGKSHLNVVLVTFLCVGWSFSLSGCQAHFLSSAQAQNMPAHGYSVVSIFKSLSLVGICLSWVIF